MDSEWEESQRRRWEHHYTADATSSQYSGSPNKPQGIRHYYREMLFRQVRPEVSGQLWIDVGAGTSFTIADLIHPTRYDYRYVATDINKTALYKSRDRTEQTPILSAATHLPFREGRAYVVSAFGVLQYLPAWKETLRILIDLLKPYGYIMLTGSISKPRIFARWRKESYTARFDPPQEIDICGDGLRAILVEQCDILLWDYSGSPLRFGLLWFAKLDRSALHSYRMTQLLVGLDKLWLATIGRLTASLAGREIVVLAQKRCELNTLPDGSYS